MTLQELFDTLLDTRQVQVVLSKDQAESLRVQLVKKWNKYKLDMDAVGFLADDLQRCSLCRRTSATADGTYTFSLEPKKRSLTQYEVLLPDQEPIVTT